MFRKLSLFLIALLFMFSYAFAAMTDEAVLGNDRWSVDSSGYLVPNANATYNLGSSSYRANTLYGATVNITGDLTFRSNLLSNGVANGGVSVMTTPVTAIPTTYSLVKMIVSTKDATLANGTPNQVLSIVGVDRTGTTTITPATSTGWASASMDADGETLKLQYIDDTYGWIVAGYSGTTITGKNSGAN